MADIKLTEYREFGRDGVAWNHDTLKTAKTPVDAIAEHVHRIMAEDAVEIGQTANTKITLAQIPDVETIKTNIANKTPFAVKSEDGYEITAEWLPEHNSFIVYFFRGMGCVEYSYRTTG